MSEPTSHPNSAPATLPPVKRRRWLALVLTAIIFVSGLAIGSGLTFMYADYRRAYYLSHPEEVPRRFTQRLRRVLKLTDEQAVQVEAIVAARWPKFQETRRQVYPILSQHLDAFRVEVAAVLRPDQLDRWDRYIERIRKMWNPPPPAAGPDQEPASAPSPSPPKP